jgi:PAS domain S-box-containing protein
MMTPESRAGFSPADVVKGVGSATGLPPVNILLVDDEPKNLLALDAILASDDRQLVHAASGLEALRHLLETDFAVILLDVQMPEMDGFDTAELIRNRERSRNTPIIFLTAASRDELFISRGYSIGAVDYILKPVDADTLRSKVGVFVELFRKTEQVKQQAQQLAETSAFLHSVLESTTDYAILPLDLSGQVLAWTEGARRVYGYTADEMVGHARISALHTTREPARESLEALLEVALRQGKVEAELEGVRRDGHHFAAAVTIDQRLDAHGEIVGFVAVARDVSRLKQAEQERALLVQEQVARAGAERAAARLGQLQLVTAALSAAASPVQVAAAAVQQCLTALGARAGVFALPTDDGAALTVVAAEGVAPGAPAAWEAVALDAPARVGPAGSEPPGLFVGSSAEMAARFGGLAAQWALADGQSAVWAYVPLLLGDRALGVLGLAFAEPQPVAEDDPAFWLGIGRQCALALERARLYEAERAARATAEGALRTRDEFLTIAAHELKNPVAAVKGSAQLMRRGYQLGTLEDERLARLMTIIEQETGRLATLVDELLDVARLEQGRLQLRLQAVDLRVILQQIVARARGETSQHALHVECAPGSATVMADPIRLDQVLTNLVGNALKYSPEGGDVRITLATEGEGRLIRIRDEGIGLPDGAAELIFQPFGRAANAAVRNLPGLGLGLYICRQIVERHAGRIWAESAGEGTGTIFNVWLPERGPDPDEPADG